MIHPFVAFYHIKECESQGKKPCFISKQMMIIFVNICQSVSVGDNTLAIRMFGAERLRANLSGSFTPATDGKGLTDVR